MCEEASEVLLALRDEAGVQRFYGSKYLRTEIDRNSLWEAGRHFQKQMATRPVAVALNDRPATMVYVFRTAVLLDNDG